MGILAYITVTVLSAIIFSFALVALRREGSTDLGFALSMSVVLISGFVMAWSAVVLIVTAVNAHLRKREPASPQPPWPTLRQPPSGGGGGTSATSQTSVPTVAPKAAEPSPLGRERTRCQSSVQATPPAAEKVTEAPSLRRRNQHVLWAYRNREPKK